MASLDWYIVLFAGVQVLNVAGAVIGAASWAVYTRRQHRNELEDMAAAHRVQLREIDSAYARERIDMQESIRALEAQIKFLTGYLNSRGFNIPTPMPQIPPNVTNNIAGDYNNAGDTVAGGKGQR